MDIKLEIQKMAKEIGISKIGFTTADDFKPSFPLQLPIRISCHNNPKKQNISVAKSLQIHGV